MAKLQRIRAVLFRFLVYELTSCLQEATKSPPIKASSAPESLLATKDLLNCPSSALESLLATKDLLNCPELTKVNDPNACSGVPFAMSSPPLAISSSSTFVVPTVAISAAPSKPAALPSPISPSKEVRQRNNYSLCLLNCLVFSYVICRLMLAAFT
jgi:hypothetical protein